MSVIQLNLVVVFDGDANIVGIRSRNSWVFDLGLPNVLDDIEQGNVGSDSKSPR